MLKVLNLCEDQIVCEIVGHCPSVQVSPKGNKTIFLRSPADSLMLGTEVELQQVENSVLAIESVLKVWLQEQGGDQERLHLLLPSDNLTPG